MINAKDVPPMPPPHFTTDNTDQQEQHEKLIDFELDKLRIRHEAKRRFDTENQPPVEQPPIKRLDQFLTEPDTEQQYRIEAVAPADARIILSAQYKAGKTTLVGNLMRSLVDGNPFLDRFTVNTPATNVVLIDDELSERTVRRWLRDQNITNTTKVHVITLRGKLAAFNLLDDTVRAQWAERLGALGCDYLILDCLRPVLDALGLDENRDAGKFLVAYDALLSAAGINDSLVVQHMGHANERARGDSRLQDWPDATWRMVRETEEPDSPRFFSAYGRDVDIAEGRLAFNPDTRHLTYAAGSRADADVEAAFQAVIQLLAVIAESSHGDWFSKNHIEGDLGLSGHKQKAARQAIKVAVARDLVEVMRGPRNAQLHRIKHPCSKCGYPTIDGRPRHESCPSETGDLLLK